MRVLYLATVYLHLMAAITLVGGSIFVVLNIFPFARRPEHAQAAPLVSQWIGLRFRKFRWHSIALLIVTGFGILGLRGIGPSALLNGAAWNGAWGMLLAHKLALVVVIVALGLASDFVFGKRIAAAVSAGERDEAAKAKATVELIAKVSLGVGFLLVLLGALLARGV